MSRAGQEARHVRGGGGAVPAGGALGATGGGAEPAASVESTTAHTHDQPVLELGAEAELAVRRPALGSVRSAARWRVMAGRHASAAAVAEVAEGEQRSRRAQVRARAPARARSTAAPLSSRPAKAELDL